MTRLHGFNGEHQRNEAEPKQFGRVARTALGGGRCSYYDLSPPYPHSSQPEIFFPSERFLPERQTLEW